jgi:parvulin-like peptidyl-prolyl isomerase
VLGYYNKNIEDYTQSAQVAIYTILIKFDSVRTRKESRKLIEDIRAIIADGRDFRETAANYTEGPNKEAGGDMGFVEPGQLLKELDTVIFSMRTGELSPIIESHLGYHLCQVYDKKDQKVVVFDDVKDKVRTSLYRAKAEKEFEDWLDNLKTNAYISIK